MQIINTTALITINETLIVQLVSFLIFLFIINRLMFRPLRRVMSERENHIGRIRQDISEADHELDVYTQRMEAQKEAVTEEAFESARMLEASGRTSADEIIASVLAEISSLRETALQDLDARIAEARKGLRPESEKLAVGIMEKILERRLGS